MKRMLPKIFALFFALIFVGTVAFAADDEVQQAPAPADQSAPSSNSPDETPPAEVKPPVDETLPNQGQPPSDETPPAQEPAAPESQEPVQM